MKDKEGYKMHCYYHINLGNGKGMTGREDNLAAGTTYRQMARKLFDGFHIFANWNSWQNGSVTIGLIDNGEFWDDDPNETTIEFKEFEWK